MKTCHHCGYEWTPRKAEPRKCPQCQNSLWRSPRPKKFGGGGSGRHLDRRIKNESRDGEKVQVRILPPEPSITPIEKDTLSEAKAKAEALLRRLA